MGVSVVSAHGHWQSVQESEEEEGRSAGEFTVTLDLLCVELLSFRVLNGVVLVLEVLVVLSVVEVVVVVVVSETKKKRKQCYQKIWTNKYVHDIIR